MNDENIKKKKYIEKKRKGMKIQKFKIFAEIDLCKITPFPPPDFYNKFFLNQYL
jgi:hypothetical protein